jgi:hypothetical protein
MMVRKMKSRNTKEHEKEITAYFIVGLTFKGYAE